MQLEIQFEKDNQLEIDFSEIVDTTSKEILNTIVYPDVVDIWHRDNCHCNECYKYGVGSYRGRKE